MSDLPNITRSVDLGGLAKLRAPFPDEAVGKLPKGIDKSKPKASCRVCHGYHEPAAVHLDFIGHAHVRERLLDVDPLWNWRPRYETETGPVYERDSKNQPVGLWIDLTICGVTKSGYGSCESGKSDPVKELIGDAIRNAGLNFGIALEYWKKEWQRSDDTRQAEAQPPASQAPREGSGASPRAAGSTAPRGTQPPTAVIKGITVEPAPDGPHRPAEGDADLRTLSQLTIIGRIADPARLSTDEIQALFEARYGHELRVATKNQTSEFATWLKGAVKESSNAGA